MKLEFNTRIREVEDKATEGEKGVSVRSTVSNRNSYSFGQMEDTPDFTIWFDTASPFKIGERVKVTVESI